MEQAHSHNTRRVIFLLAFSVFIHSNLSAIETSQCECYFCEERPIEETTDYEGLGEFEEIFREFERRADEEEIEDIHQRGFLKKWCKKIKRWFKKKVEKVMKKIVNFKKMRDPEYCAYKIAKFKRKIDKKVYRTGSLEKMLHRFDRNLDSPTISSKMEPFKDRIRFYYHNKREKPQHHQERYDQLADELKEIPAKALWAGVELTCGGIIAHIPFPGCNYLGCMLIGKGFNDMFDAWRDYALEQEEQAQANP